MSSGRRGRPERPIDTTVPALAELARELRELRRGAGFSLDQLARRIHSSKAALSMATTGRNLPSRTLVVAWVLACDPRRSADVVGKRYDKVAEAYWAAILPVPVAAPAPAPVHLPAVVDAAPVVPAEPHFGSKAADLFEQAAWASLEPDRRTWGIAAHPAPLPLRFTPAPVDFTDAGPNPPDLTGRYAEIADVYALVPSGRLVVLGERGSGKTQLARHLGTQLLTADDPVLCVLISLTGCDALHELPAFLDWLAGRLPGDSPHEIAAMLGRGRLVPVLDDFDRLGRRERARLLLTLDQLPDSARFVLVGGWSEYATAVEDTDTVPAGCAAVRIQPVGVDDLDGWIQRGSRRAEAKRKDWDDVLDALRGDPRAPARKVLADPLLAGAARVLFTDGRGDPAELVAPDADAELLEKRLLDHLLGTFAPRRLLHPEAVEERRLERLLRLMGHAVRERGGPVRDLRVLYVGVRHTRRWAAIHTFVLAVLCFAVPAEVSAGADRYTSSGATDVTFGVTGLLFLCPYLYAYLRHDRDDRLDPNADAVRLAVRMLVLPAPTVVAGFVLTATAGLAPGLVLTVLFVLCQVLSTRLSRPPYRPSGLDGLLSVATLLLMLVAALLIGSPVGFLIVVHLLALSTLSGSWALSRMVFRHRHDAIAPHHLHRTLHLAVHRGVLTHTPQGFVFTHHAVARWYADAKPPDVRERSAA
ncbi:helix-turn-helix domain-containing protein [Streptomyces sp. NPDC001941]|uniref:helix-turn-helix domain-containing protein n=1 Tax=Streptomyces sp. NPDC001941 TaxID=3154659 RepID=UPI003327104A